MRDNAEPMRSEPYSTALYGPSGSSSLQVNLRAYRAAPASAAATAAVDYNFLINILVLKIARQINLQPTFVPTTIVDGDRDAKSAGAMTTMTTLISATCDDQQRCLARRLFSLLS